MEISAIDPSVSDRASESTNQKEKENETPLYVPCPGSS